MKKGFKFYLICWVILLALFNIICFVTPSEADGLDKFGGAFWAGYVFITLAFSGQLACAYFAFKAENLKKLFYNMPLITISYTGLILTIIVGALCMAIPDLPNWVAIVVCSLILGFNAMSIVQASAAVSAIEAVDTKIAANTFFIKNQTMDAEKLIGSAKGDAIRKECKKVYEAFRYSDPMSNEVLADIESKITAQMEIFKEAVGADAAENIGDTADELIGLINERNSKCKLLK